LSIFDHLIDPQARERFQIARAFNRQHPRPAPRPSAGAPPTVNDEFRAEFERVYNAKIAELLAARQPATTAPEPEQSLQDSWAEVAAGLNAWASAGNPHFRYPGDGRR
jgi:hypothetical protein